MLLMGEAHTLSMAADQPDADLFLQLLDGQGRARLGNQHCRGRREDRRGFGHGDDVMDLAQGHDRSLTKHIRNGTDRNDQPLCSMIRRKSCGARAVPRSAAVSLPNEAIMSKGWGKPLPTYANSRFPVNASCTSTQ